MHRLPALPLLALLAAAPLFAYGPYPRQAPGLATWAGTESTALPGTSDYFAGWATEITITYGTNVSDIWKTPARALGPSVGPAPASDPYHDGDALTRTGGVYDIVAIGSGGQATVRFDQPIRDGEGWDLAVFENSFNDEMLELAYVEVSTNGTHFVRFPSVSLTASTVGAFGRLDARDIDGLAGKYRIGYGTPFDLDQLRDLPGSEHLDFDAIRYVRIVDIVGDGLSLDSRGMPIYDPYPVTGSAGFDLEAVGYVYAADLAAPKLTIADLGNQTARLSWNAQAGARYTVLRWLNGTWTAGETLAATTSGPMTADATYDATQPTLFRLEVSWTPVE